MQNLTDNLFVAGQLSAEDFEIAKQHGVTLIINNRPDGEEFGIMSVADATALAEQHGMKYLHLPMANGAPLPEDLVPNMQAALAEQEANNGKTLAHCRSGTRSSFLWAIVKISEGKLTTSDAINAAASAGINLNGFAQYLQHVEANA